jgi:hypothetical protein
MVDELAALLAVSQPCLMPLHNPHGRFPGAAWSGLI